MKEEDLRARETVGHEEARDPGRPFRGDPFF